MEFTYLIQGFVYRYTIITWWDDEALPMTKIYNIWLCDHHYEQRDIQLWYSLVTACSHIQHTSWDGIPPKSPL